jgi:hypothetical protein
MPNPNPNPDDKEKVPPPAQSSPSFTFPDVAQIAVDVLMARDEVQKYESN